MSIILTSDAIAQVAEAITNEASNISYNVDVDTDEMARCVILAWERIVEMEFEHIDSIQEDDEIKEILRKSDIDLQDIIENNDDFGVESYWFEQKTSMSLNEFKQCIEWAILSDLGSAWVNLIRETIQGIFGEDPLGNNEGVKFAE